MAIRVYEIAKEYSRTPEEIMKILSKAGFAATSLTSELDEHALHTLTAKLGKFKLTVVDGDHEEVNKAADDNQEARKAGKKKKKAAAKPPAPRLAVRVIKKHDTPADEASDDSNDNAPTPPPAKPKPKLRKAKGRGARIEERIHKMAERQGGPESPQPQGEQARGEDKAAEVKPEQLEERAGNTKERSEARSAAPTAQDQGDRSKQDDQAGARGRKKRAETPIKFERGLSSNADEKDRSTETRQRDRRNDRDRPPRGDRPRMGDRGQRLEGGRPQNFRDRQGGDRPGGDRPGGDRPAGDRPNYRGDRSYSRDGQRGDRPPGGGNFNRGDRPGGGGGSYNRGDRPGGGGGGGFNRGDRPGGGGGGGFNRGDRPSGGGGGNFNRGGPGGGGGGNFNRGGPGGGGGGNFNRGGPGGGGGGGFNRGGGGPGGGGGGGFNRGGGGPGGGGGGTFGRGGGPPSSPMNDARGPVRSRFGAQKPKKKKKRRKNEEQIEKIKVVTTSRVELPSEDLGIIMLSEGATVKEISEKVNRKAKDVIKRLFEKGIMATLNDVLDAELAIEIAKDFGYLAEIVSFEEDLQIKEEENIEASDSKDDQAVQETRAPIVTIMGHVDHGKTTLLDAIRKAKVADGEAGGITQHIGAYSVPYGEKRIVFLDTPGHEAFTKMRARGASVTDVVILVVAADDGVKPQTVEAINHAKAAKVPIITCINKIDKPEANPARVKQMLTEHELVVEEFGGDSPCVEVSAKQNIGLDDLLEMILLVSELNDYKASPTRMAKGTVIESKLDRGRGPVATVVIQDGTLRVGDYFITGQTYGKIRAMHDDLGRGVEEAPPSTPVEILGVQEVPAAGDPFQVIEDEISARKISSFRKEKAREDQLRRQKHTSLDQLFSNLKQTEVKDLTIIIKADVQGSIEGLVFALNKIQSEKVNLRIVHQGVGSITENDVLLAVASDSIIIGFNTKPERKAQDLAEQEGIDVRLYTIIYEVVKEIEAAMLGLVAPTFEEREIGTAVVKQVFSVAKLGKVAGCYVENGRIQRDAKVRVVRDGKELHNGTLQTLKRFRDDVNEVKNGYECGIGIRDYSDIQEGDVLNFFILEEVQATQL